MNAIFPAPDVEIIAPGEGVIPVTLQRNPFSLEASRHAARAGDSLFDIVSSLPVGHRLATYFRIWIGEHEVPRELWRKVRPKPGACVHVKVFPRGGGGEGGGKSTLATILGLAVMVAAFVFGGPLGSALVGKAGVTIFGATISAAAIGGAIITVAGTLLITALIPPPSPPRPPALEGLEAPNNQITGISNKFAPFSPIPRVFGKRRVFPIFAARPFSEGQGDEQFVRLLLLVGYGPLQVSDIKIGETPISAFDGVETEIREGWPDDEPITLYTQQVREDGQSATLATSGTPADDYVVRTTEAGTREISIDITFVSGLAVFDSRGRTSAKSVSFDVQYREVGASTFKGVEWLNDADKGFEVDGQINASDKTRQQVRYSGRFRPSEGVSQYEVRIRRTTVEENSTGVLERAVWTMLRSIRDEPPVNMSGLCLIALRMKATNQLNQTPDTINVIAESFLPVYDGSEWTYEVTRNPAWAYADVLRRRGLETLTDDDRIDLTTIKAWADDADVTAPNADEPTWTFDAVLEGGSMFEAMKTIASHGRATPGMKDGKFSVVRDIEQATPVQHISPRNSFNYSGKKTFVDLPHAIRVRFVNEEAGYQQDERIVYADGFDEDTATRFETIEALGHTSPTLVFREARYHLATLALRPEVHKVSMDIEALRCTRGDRVQFSHDVVSIGLGSGRIKSLTLDGSGDCEAIELDESVPMESGKDYAMRVRFADGDTSLISLQNLQGGFVSTVYPETPLAPSATPEVGDLFMFGEADRESAACIVKSVTPGPDLTAVLELFDYNDAIYAADQADIPPHVSIITSDVFFGQEVPPAPEISGVRSDETVLFRAPDGTLVDRIRVSIAPLASGTVAIDRIEFQISDAGENVFDQIKLIPASQHEVFFDGVQQGESYDIRVRTIGRNNLSSDWVTESAHEVIGKTTPPTGVTGFAGLRLTSGVQLSWDANTDVDLAGYRLKRGDDWATGTVISQLTEANSLFVALDTSAAVKFHVKAVDVLGIESGEAATVTVSLAVPDDVENFEAYPDGDLVRFTWNRVGSDGFTYEIRQGSSFESARLVGRSAGDTMTKQWPVKSSGEVTFLIKAISPAGLLSANATEAEVTQDPLADRNVVVSKDWKTLTWPGVLHDCSVNGSGNLEVDKVSDVNHPFADYYAEVALGASYYARNWFEGVLNVVTNSGVTWDELTDAWDDVSAAWDGTLTAVDGAALKVYLAAEASALPSNVTEAFTFDNSTTGENATTAAVASGVTYEPCRFADGLLVGALTQAKWSVSYGTDWTMLFDIRLDSALTDDHLVIGMNGSGVWLRLIYEAETGQYVLIDQDANRIAVTLTREEDDVITFGISQTSGTRRLFAASRRYPTVVSAEGALAPVGSITEVSLYV